MTGTFAGRESPSGFSNRQAPWWRREVLDHGFVELINASHQDRQVSGLELLHGEKPNEKREAMDLAVVNAARVSMGAHSRELTDKDRRLIVRLYEDRHATPFEHPTITWRVRAPIFVFREWHRHRTASISEISGRYVELKEEFYVPAVEDMRSQVGTAMSYEYEAVPEAAARGYQAIMRKANESAFATYRWMLAEGVAKEIARTVLPVGTYSEMQWTCNVRNLMHFLTLRNAPQAQREIQTYAAQMEELWAAIMPVTARAFIDSGRRGL